LAHSCLTVRMLLHPSRRAVYRESTPLTPESDEYAGKQLMRGRSLLVDVVGLLLWCLQLGLGRRSCVRQLSVQKSCSGSASELMMIRMHSPSLVYAHVFPCIYLAIEVLDPITATTNERSSACAQIDTWGERLSPPLTTKSCVSFMPSHTRWRTRNAT